MSIPAVLGPLVSTVGSSLLGAVKTAVTGGKTPDRLDKNDFLKLLVAQLKNQNPLNPLSNDQFIAQSAAFSSLEQLQNISKGVDAMAAGGNGASLASASALLGRPVRATTGTFTYNGTAASLPYTLDAPVANAVLEITDGAGTVVARQALGAQMPGPHTAPFVSAARPLAAGAYRYRIVTVDAAGQSTPLTAVGGTVTGITMANGVPILAVGSIGVGLNDVATIGTPTN